MGKGDVEKAGETTSALMGLIVQRVDDSHEKRTPPPVTSSPRFNDMVELILFASPI